MVAKYIVSGHTTHIESMYCFMPEEDAKVDLYQSGLIKVTWNRII